MKKETPLQILRKKREAIVGEYLERFIKKEGYEFDGWVAEEIGGVASFIEQWFIGFDDIVYNIENKRPVGEIWEWLEYNLDLGTGQNINYYSYSKGLRIDKKLQKK